MIAELDLEGLDQINDDGFVIHSTSVRGEPATVIAANTDQGVLYGVYHFLRLIQTQQPIDDLALVQSPRIERRVLNHWDNLDRTVERGYAGFSLWEWHKLPDYLNPRYIDYARANASLGINGTVLTNVNADATVLMPRYLDKVKALADLFRPYGIRVYLTARFSAPMEIGGLETADPLDPDVRAWWQSKVDEIYERIPDFGGFLVKANSEGSPDQATMIVRMPREPTCWPMRWLPMTASSCGERSCILLWLMTGASKRTTSSCHSTATSTTMCWCRSRMAPSTSSLVSPSIRSLVPCRVHL